MDGRCSDLPVVTLPQVYQGLSRGGCVVIWLASPPSALLKWPYASSNHVGILMCDLV